jgi:hypothetical protein
VGWDSRAFSGTFVVNHPAFGKVTFVFDSLDANSGFATTEGFIYLGVEYPKFDFGFQREGGAFTESDLNDVTRHQVRGHWQTISEIAPPAFRSFVLSKAKELANSPARIP